jgi:hypothetical protein
MWRCCEHLGLDAVEHPLHGCGLHWRQAWLQLEKGADERQRLCRGARGGQAPVKREEFEVAETIKEALAR